MWTREQFEAAITHAEIELMFLRGRNLDKDVERCFTLTDFIRWCAEQRGGGLYLQQPEECDPLWRGEGEERP